MFKRILVPIDGSHTSWVALQKAIDLAKEQKAKLRVVEVVDLGPLYRAVPSGLSLVEVEKAIIGECEKDLAHADELARQAGVDVETALVSGSQRRISSEILEEADKWHADLIVMGTHGRHGLQRFVLGSVAEGVVRESRVPVLLIRSQS